MPWRPLKRWEWFVVGVLCAYFAAFVFATLLKGC